MKTPAEQPPAPTTEDRFNASAGLPKQLAAMQLRPLLALGRATESAIDLIEGLTEHKMKLNYAKQMVLTLRANLVLIEFEAHTRLAHSQQTNHRDDPRP